MQQAFKTMMGQMDPQTNQFNNAAFPPGSPFSFPPPSSGPANPSSPVASPHPVTVDVSATKVEAAVATDVKDENEIKKEPKKIAFVDISPEETLQKSPYESYETSSETSSMKDASSADKVSQNGAASKQDADASQGPQSTGKAGSALSVEALEKMMEDPTVQKMVYPYLPEEMRNPTTFKWMLQNPQYRQQLEDML